MKSKIKIVWKSLIDGIFPKIKVFLVILEWLVREGLESFFRSVKSFGKFKPSIFRKYRFGKSEQRFHWSAVEFYSDTWKSCMLLYLFQLEIHTLTFHKMCWIPKQIHPSETVRWVFAQQRTIFEILSNFIRIQIWIKFDSHERRYSTRKVFRHNLFHVYWWSNRKNISNIQIASELSNFIHVT